VGLLILDHLQAVLEPAQESVGLGELLGGARVDTAGLFQRGEGLGGARVAQARIAAAVDQLLGLGEELDLADAAAAKLDVVARQGDFGAALVGVNLALDGVDVLECPEVQVLAPDERLELAQEGLAQGQVAGHRPRLDHGRPLPVLAHAFVVGQRRIDGQRQRHGGRVGPQAQVDPEDVAVAGALLHQRDQVAGQAHQGLLGRASAAIIDPRRVEQHDDVDVGGVVELAGPELAHGENHHAAVLERPFGVWQHQLVAGRGLAQQVGQRDRQGGGCEAGQRAGHLLQRPGAGQIRQRDQKRHPPARRAQRLHQTPAVRIVRLRRLESCDQVAQKLLRTVA
jgi:hypothetical protein